MAAPFAQTELIDYACAFVLWIISQYWLIKPMKLLAAGRAVVAAIKADTFSLTAWQVGMYGGMAISTYIFGRDLDKTNPVFWLVTQWPMPVGFVTSYPINVWLLRHGIKEAM